ncbi:MAG TPA: bacteriocin immunity protein [Archangium sp.]|nr:bacteriocin immunity protein [Archangium sp.]
MSKLSREQLIEIARKLLSGGGDDAEVTSWIDELQANVPYPGVSDLIFYPEGNRDPTPEEVVDKALSYKPPPSR